MLKKLIFVVFIVSLVSQANLGRSEDYTFRKAKWGMAPKEVTASESGVDPVSIDESTITYKTQILGKNVELMYLFYQNKLTGATYRLDDNYLNSNHFLSTYNKFKAALTQKYGPPQDETITWTNDTLRNVSLKRGLALSLGHTEYYSSWETPQTTINMTLKEDNYHVHCRIEYWSKELFYLAGETRKEDILDPF